MKLKPNTQQQGSAIPLRIKDSCLHAAATFNVFAPSLKIFNMEI